MNRRFATIAALSWLFLSTRTPDLQAQWSTAQGGNPARTARSAGIGPRTKVSRWSLDRPHQVALMPLVAGGLVVTSLTHDWQSEEGTVLVAVESATGRRRWSLTLPPSSSGLGWWSRAVAFDGTRIYASRGSNGLVDEFLYALDPADGSILWQSEDLVNLGLGGSPTFLPAGDLVVCGEFLGSFLGYNHLRIDAANGRTLWERPRFIGAEEGSGSVVGNRLYAPVYSAGGTSVARIQPDSGDLMYVSTPAGDGTSTSGVPLAIDRGGAIYLQVQTLDAAQNRTLGELIAWRDTGSNFQHLWSAAVGASAWSTLAIDGDGSVIVLGRDGRVQKRSSLDGSVLAASLAPVSVPWIPVTFRAALDATGKVYATVTPTWDGRLFSFDSDLRLLWRKELITSPLGGPTLARDGTLLLATFERGLEAY